MNREMRQAQKNDKTHQKLVAELRPMRDEIGKKMNETLESYPGYKEAVAAERRVVDVGFTDDEHAQILSGLETGELVVVKGQRSLKHGSPLKVLETVQPGAGS